MKIDHVKENPICPHCKKQIARLLCTSDGALMVHNVYFCPLCKNIVGVGYSAGG